MINVVRSRHFLVAEDNGVMLSLVSELLRLLGAKHVHAVTDGAAAMKFICRSPVDVLITDFKMAPVTGVELVRWVRQDPQSANPEIGVIMTSAYSEPQRVTAARDAGVNEFLVKPINIERLHKRLRAVLMQKRPFIRTDAYIGPCRRRNVDPSYSGPFRRADDQAGAAKAGGGLEQIEI